MRIGVTWACLKNLFTFLVQQTLGLFSRYYAFVYPSLVPHNRATFSPARYITHGDIIWGPPGVHIITKSTKNMQVSGHVRVVQLPLLADKEISPVTALKCVVSSNPRNKDLPVFTISVAGNPTILTAHKVRSALRQVVVRMGLQPTEFGFHAFRRSGATWAYKNNINLQHIKTHGGWSSDAIWAYLQKTPTAAGKVARSFQQAFT